MKKPGLVLVLALTACGGDPAPVAEGPTSQNAESFMWAYTEAWNAHDTEALGHDFWQMTGSVEEETARLEAIFAQLEADGYDQSFIHGISACMANTMTTALAGVQFTRYLTSGEVMGPDLRGSRYRLDWEDDKGWRITEMFPVEAEDALGCDLSILD